MKKAGTRHSSSTVLYDAGGWFVFVLFFGVPGAVGLVVDYLWNYLMISPI